MQRLIWMVVLFVVASQSAWAQLSSQPRPPRPTERPTTIAAPTADSPIDPAAVIIEWNIVIAEWKMPPTDDTSAKDVGLEGPATQVKEQLAALEKQGKLQVVQRLRLHTLEGQPAFQQFGARRPQVNSSQVTNFGTVNSFTYQEVGTLLSITASVKDGVVLGQFSLRRTDLVTPVDAPAISESKTGDKVRAASIQSSSTETAVRISSDQTVVISGVADKAERQLILATVKIVK